MINNINIDELALNSPTLVLIRRAFSVEWPLWSAGAIFTFLVAYLFTSNLNNGFVSGFYIPFVYGSDGLFHSWMIQRLIEGSLFDNPRSGYPFGSTFLDFPGSDFAQHLILKFLGLIFEDFQLVFNVYFLLGFSITFICSYIALRGFGISILFALAGAFIFDFLPFHFLRINHLFFTWYFVIPIYFSIALVCFESKKHNIAIKYKSWKVVILIFGLLFVASFGVYYAFFGLIVLFLAGLSGGIVSRNFYPLGFTTFFIVIIVSGVLINFTPYIIYKFQAGSNNEIAQRTPAESEIYGFKMMQLIFPRKDHRSSYLSNLTREYNQTTPLVNENENDTSSLGIIGSTGFLLIFAVLFIHVSGGMVDQRLSLISLIVLLLFFFGTIGGFGSLFAIFISPLIRGWNRVSIFIAFGSIAGFLIFVQELLKNKFSNTLINSILISFSLIILSIYDQISPGCVGCREIIKNDFEKDRGFINEIEKKLVSGSAIYQLPYSPFPEAPTLNSMKDYDLSIGYLHSKNLKWSYGGTKGRSGDLFFRALSAEPIERQIQILQTLGFSGIYVDRRGYSDNGNKVIAELTNLLKEPPSLEHSDGRAVFFVIKAENNNQVYGLSPERIMAKANYFVDRLGHRYEATLEDGIVFAKKDWPIFLRNVNGLSVLENWGRWSDSRISKSVRFDFKDVLPKKFTLEINLKTFGTNGGKLLKIKIGNKLYEIKLPETEGVIYLNVVNAELSDFIELYPPNPTAPSELGISADNRKLGIGLVSMAINELN